MRRLVIAAVIVFAAAVGRAQGAQGQPPPKNLKVLPKDMTRGQVVQMMRSFTRSLGVRCEHCHVGEGNDMSKFDFAADDKPTKEIARKMIAMVMDINSRHLAGVGELPAAPAAGQASAAGQAPALKVTCYTCHRGDRKPLTAAPPAEGRGGAR